MFAIALALLVLGIDPQAVSLDNAAGVFIDQPGELVGFAISFAVIAYFWWVHHRFFGALGHIEPGLIVLNLVFLGLVALVPFPTSLLSRDPAAQGAVVPYLALLALIALVLVLLLLRAHTAAAWRVPPPDGLLRWLVAGWGSSAAVNLVALAVAFFVPVAGLLLLLLTWPIEAIVAHYAPDGYSDWG